MLSKKISTRAAFARRLASHTLIATVLFVCTACPANHTTVNVEFSAIWDGQPIRCDDAEYSLTDLRFFVHDLVLIDAAGVERALQLKSNERGQQRNVALIDLENGEGSCSNGTSQTNTGLSGVADAGDIHSLRFTLGVPFELNHANPMLAEEPLDDAAMHWHWRSGYKFLRAGITTGSDSFWLHLGSTACQGTVQNISSCRSPNRVTVELPVMSSQDLHINIDLSMLFAGVDLHDGARSDCSSGPSESACVAPFAALGLPFADVEEPTIPKPVFRAAH